MVKAYFLLTWLFPVTVRVGCGGEGEGPIRWQALKASHTVTQPLLDVTLGQRRLDLISEGSDRKQDLEALANFI